MNVTTTGLTRGAAAAAVAAGTIFVAVQINHPPMTVASVETTDWLVRDAAKMTMSALALAGITGMYLRQVRETRWLGLVGYLVFAAGYLTMFGVETVATIVLPSLTATDPGYVNDVIVAAFGGTPTGDIGQMQTMLTLSGVGYMLGGLLFGIALFRARILSRWAAALLAVGTMATAALAALPDSFNRPFAVPVGIALIGLGVSLWREARSPRTPSESVLSTNLVHEPAAR
jgi:hypothetical protein